MPHAHENKIPVTVITGFLGSGKTTLLKRILSDATHGKRIAVIENELALAIGLDRELIDSTGNDDQIKEVFEFGNGCMCCSSRGEFQRVLFEILHNQRKYDYIVIETTGLADPIFIQSLFDPDVMGHVYLDGVVTVVDAKNVFQHLNASVSTDKTNEVHEQLLYADRILLNKVDTVSEEDVKRIIEKIRTVNTIAKIESTEFSQVSSIDFILNIDAFNLDRMVELRPQLKNTNVVTSQSHNSEVQPVLIMGKGRLVREKFEDWLRATLSVSGQDVYRMKGLLAFSAKVEQYILQGVHGDYNIQQHATAKWEEDPPVCKLILIGKNIDKNRLANEFGKVFEQPVAAHWMD